MNKIYGSDNTVVNTLNEMQIGVEEWTADIHSKTYVDLKSYGQSVFDKDINQQVYAAYNALMYFNCDKGSTEKSILIRHELERLKMRLF